MSLLLPAWLRFLAERQLLDVDHNRTLHELDGLVDGVCQVLSPTPRTLGCG